MANAFQHQTKLGSAARSAAIVLTFVSVFASGCGQRSSPPPESQSAAPPPVSPLTVESGESPSNGDSFSPFATPRDPSTPPAEPPPFNSPPFDPPTNSSPPSDAIASGPLEGDTAPPTAFPNAPGFEPAPSPDLRGGTLAVPEIAAPRFAPPAFTPPGNAPPGVAPPEPVNPLANDPGSRDPDSRDATGPPTDEQNSTGEDSSPEARLPVNRFSESRNNPLRADSAAAPLRARVNPLRSGAAGFAPFRPRTPQASLEDEPPADGSGFPLAPPPTAPPPGDLDPATVVPDPVPAPAAVDDPRAVEPEMNPGSAAPDGPSSPRDTESTARGSEELEPSELTPPGDRSSHRNITDKPIPGSAFGADPETGAGSEPGSDAKPAAAAAGTNNVIAGDYTTVRVFYATDRTRLDAFDLRQLSWRPLPWLPVVALSAAALALLTGSLFRKMSGRGWVAGLAAALSAVAILIAGGPLYLGHVRLSTLVERITGGSRAADPPRSIASGAESTAGDQSATGQRPDRANPDLASSTPAVNVYGNGRGELEFGECAVTIPRRHEPGKIERPSLWRLEFHESLDRHVVLRTVERRGEDAFFTAVRERVASSPRSDLFVFIHGYNVSFDMAARRTAQMAHDLKFEGAPIFYSWPSQGGLLKYPVDETNVSWTVPHLKQFLRQLASRSEARAINVIAHSMGNRALASAVRELSLEEPLREKRFQQVVLAAPDIDAEVFQRDVAPLLASASEHVTLYASSRDQALAASKLVHGYPRAGDSGANLLVLPGIETVDVTEVDTGILGHSYYGNSVPILRDLERVLHGALTNDQRPWLQTAQRDGHPYWVFNDKSLAILQGNRHR